MWAGQESYEKHRIGKETDMNTSSKLKSFALKQMYEYLDKDPEKNIPNLLYLLEERDKDGHGITSQVGAIRKAILDPDNNWSKLVRSLWTDIDSNQRKKLVETVVINGSILGTPEATKNQEKYNCNIPWAILLDPTSACNLHCTGCWAAEYGNKLNLSLEELDSIIAQGKELGVHVFIYSGGEPLVRKKDILTLCEKHSDCAFLSFTNGTLIDDAFADEMLQVATSSQPSALRVSRRPRTSAGARVPIKRSSPPWNGSRPASSCSASPAATPARTPRSSAARSTSTP